MPIAVLVASALVPVGLLAAGARLRLPVPLVAGTLVALAVSGAYVASARSGGGPVGALRDAVPRLLTAPRPAPATPDLLLPGAFFAMLVGVWVAVRTLSSAGLVAAPAGAAALYAAGALLTAGRADRHGVVATALVLLTVASWLLLDRPPNPARRAADPRHAAPAVALALGLALLAGLVPVTGAFEPRRLVDPPHRTLDEPSPLPRIAAWQQNGDVELLRVTGGGTRLRLVTLAEFTGANWSATATYRPLGAEASTALPPGRNQVRLDATVIVAALDGPWLPSPGAPLATSVSSVDVEPESGSLALRDGLRPGLAYRISAVRDAPRADDVASAAVPAGATVQPYLRTPRLPRLFAEYARQVSFGASTPFEQAVAIEAAVRADRRHDPGAPTGSSYARLETFLFREEGAEPGARSGTAEQFATAFAVLARAVGLPTRVVVGFRLGDPDATGTRVVYGRDAHAWPEVYFSGWGWYAFDPMPFGDDTANPDAQAKKLALDRVTSLASGSSTPASPVPASPTAPRQPPSAQPAGQAPAGTGGRLLSVPIGRVAGGTALAVLLPLVLLALARRVRRARHRMAGARGAWSEVLDLLVLLGRPAPGWLPAPEVAAELAAAVPAPGEPVHPALRIARAADRAAFAPEPPEPPEPAPGEAWAALRRAVRAAVPWRRRLVWPVNPRPLLRWRPRPPR